MLANDKVTFPSNPEVWLKDLVSLFNLKLDKLPAGEPTYANKPTGIFIFSYGFVDLLRDIKLVVVVNNCYTAASDVFFIESALKW